MSTKGKTWRQPSEALRAMRAVMRQPESEDKGPAQALYRIMLKERPQDFEKAWRGEERAQAAGKHGQVMTPSEEGPTTAPQLVPAVIDEGTERVKELLADEVAEFMQWRAQRGRGADRAVEEGAHAG